MSTAGPEKSGRVPTGTWWVTIAAATVVGVVPLLGNQLRVQDVDPQFMRDIIERVHRFGGTFYDNGIYNKGPLEPVVYNVARHLGGYDGMWFAISIFAAVAALVCAVVAARTARWSGAPTALALATGAVLYMHLTVSPSDYAGILYARNMTVALLALAWLVTFEERFWRSLRGRLVSTILLGAILGVVVQALIAEVFVAAVIGLAALAMVSVRASKEERLKLVVAGATSSVVAFASAPVWYFLRGDFSEFWASWYEDARLLNVGTRRSLGSQFALGWDKAYDYYQHRPLALLVIVAFAIFTYAAWPSSTRRERAMHLGLLGWLAGSWLEQVLNQRYSSHYFVINAFPTALMAAVLVGQAGRAVLANRRLARTMIAWPLVAIVGVIYLSGAKDFREAVKRTSRFTSVSATAHAAADSQSSTIRSVRGVLDLVSRDNDAILAWTNDPAPYLEAHRVAAGRFIWKSFLTGEIYLGASGPQYVLPHTWDWFREDVAESKPVAFVKTDGDPTPGSPFATLVASGFQLVYQGQNAVYLRKDVARKVLGASGTTPWSPPGTLPDGSGWTADPGSARYRQGTLARDNDVLGVFNHGCFRLDGTFDELPAVDFRIDPNSKSWGTDLKPERLHLRLDGSGATSASDQVAYESASSGIGATPVDFSLIVGRHAAALVVDGQVRAAMRIGSSVDVSLVPMGGSLTMSNLREGAAPPGSGC